MFFVSSLFLLSCFRFLFALCFPEKRQLCTELHLLIKPYDSIKMFPKRLKVKLLFMNNAKYIAEISKNDKRRRQGT